MRRRHWLVAIAAGVAVAGGLTLLPRVRRRRRAHLRLVAVLLAMLPRIESPDLSVGTIAQTITGWFAAVVQFIIGDIVTPIATALAWLGSQLTGYVADQWNTLLNIIGAVPTFFGTVVDFIQGVWDEARAGIRYITDNLQGWVLDFVHTALSVGGFLFDAVAAIVKAVIGAAIDITGDFARSIADLFNTLLNAALDVGAWLWHRIVNIAEQVIHDALQIGGMIYGAIGDIVAQLIQDWLQLGHWLYELLKPIIEDIVRELLHLAEDVLPDALRFIVENFDRLVHFFLFVIAHPLDWWRQWVDDLWSTGEDVLVARILAAFDANTDQVDAWLEARL